MLLKKDETSSAFIRCSFFIHAILASFGFTCFHSFICFYPLNLWSFINCLSLSHTHSLSPHSLSHSPAHTHPYTHTHTHTRTHTHPYTHTHTHTHHLSQMHTYTHIIVSQHTSSFVCFSKLSIFICLHSFLLIHPPVAFLSLSFFQPRTLAQIFGLPLSLRGLSIKRQHSYFKSVA